MTKFLKTSSIRLPQKRLLKVEEAAILESGSVPIAPLKMTMEDMTVKFAVYPWAKAAYIFLTLRDGQIKYVLLAVNICKVECRDGQDRTGIILVTQKSWLACT